MNRLLSSATICLVASASVHAAAAAQLSTQASANKVEVGQQFTVQLSCMVDSASGSPTEPSVVVPRGLRAQGPSISTQQNVSIINGHVQQQSGVVATWVVVANAPGRYRVGPASIVVNGQRLSDRPVDIEVVERGTLPQANRSSRRRRGFDPFDPFGGSDPFSGPMFPPGIDLLPAPHVDEIPSYPPDLNVDKARDTIAFLDARVSSTHLVVGEQATLRIYAYGKPGPFELMLSTEPKRDDFLSYQNERDNPIGPLYRIKIDGEVWFARKILSYALFPTKSGRLQIGEAEANFAGAGLLGSSAYRNVQRKSQPLEIIVDDPPINGRPPGYHVGDVGSFQLSATVEPRKIHATESVSVQVEVSGVGQLPQRLDPPEQTGVDWLEPTTTQQIDNQRERISGKRQFTYVVRIDHPGTVDLGTLRFPYFDPTTRKYAVATAELGKVEVLNQAAASNPTGAIAKRNEDDALLAALHARTQLGPVRPPPQYLAERRYFFPLLFAGPLLAISGFGIHRAVARLSHWRKRISGSARTLIENELKAARAAIAAAEVARAASSVERLVHLLIESSVDLKSRAVLRSELAAQLERRGLDAGTAERLVALLERSDHVKFVSADVDAARTLVEEASTLVAAMLPRLARKQRRPE